MSSTVPIMDDYSNEDIATMLNQLKNCLSEEPLYKSGSSKNTTTKPKEKKIIQYVPPQHVPTQKTTGTNSLSSNATTQESFNQQGMSTQLRTSVSKALDFSKPISTLKVQPISSSSRYHYVGDDKSQDEVRTKAPEGETKQTKTKPSLIRRFIDYNKRKDAEMRAEVEAYEAEEKLLDEEEKAQREARKQARKEKKQAKQARKAEYKADKKVNTKGIAYAAMAVGLAGLIMMGATHQDQVKQGLEDGIQTVGDKVATAIVDYVEESKEKQKEETMYNLTYENMDESTRENYSSRVEKLLESIEEKDGYEFDSLSNEELIEGYAKILERESSMIENTFKSYFNKVATDGDQELLEKIVAEAFRRRCI